jgi:hypothetical protein
MQDLKPIIQAKLDREYQAESDHLSGATGINVPLAVSRVAELFAAVEEEDYFDEVHGAHSDEVEDFCSFTFRADTSCSDVLQWWKTIGSVRFPTLSLLARDAFMIMGSSVPSESAFSDSGAFVSSDRARLTDENIEIMMKLRSWNRLLKSKVTLN